MGNWSGFRQVWCRLQSVSYVLAIAAFTALHPCAFSAQDLLCGHYCVYRSAQILGLPVTLRDVAEALPVRVPHEGHNILDLVEGLKQLGIDSDARQVRSDSLPDIPVPFISHLVDPDHFVAVEAVLSGSVLVSDSEARSHEVNLEDFLKRFDGKVILLNRSPETSEQSNHSKGSMLRFDSLYTDWGTLAEGTESATTHIPFVNCGRDTIAIESAKASCACLSATFQPKLVGPGETGTLSINAELASGAGPFDLSLYIKTNEALVRPTTMRFRGLVEKTVDVTPKTLRFGEVSSGDVVHCRLYLKALIANPLDLIVTADAPHISTRVRPIDETYIRKHYPRVGKIRQLPEGYASVVDVTLDTRGIQEGNLRGHLTVESAYGNERIRKVPYTATVVGRDASH